MQVDFKSPVYSVGYDRILNRHFSFQDDCAEQLRYWEDRFSGERIFVVGNGPSLADTPMDLLANEYSFATNNISDLYDKTRWRPSFYSVMTTNAKRWRVPIRRTLELGIPSFVWWRRAFLGYYPNIWWTDFPFGNEKRILRKDVSKYGLMKYGSSIMPCIQLSFYMGFKEIYLVGCDLGFRPKRMKEPSHNHFSDEYWRGDKEIRQSKADLWNTNMADGHRIAYEKGKSLGVKMYNATVGGELEVYPRVDLREICSSS